VDGIPPHIETSTSFHFHPHFMGKRALHSSEMPHLTYLLWGCNSLYSVQILTKGNQEHQKDEVATKPIPSTFTEE